MYMICQDSQVAKDIGLLVLRIGLGLIFMRHGIGKLLAGPELWASLGSAMSNFGIHFAYTLWGFLAACAEGLGGLLLILGLATRVAAFFIACVMIVACMMHYAKGDAWTELSHPLSLLVVFIALIIMGPGIYSLDAKCKEKGLYAKNL